MMDKVRSDYPDTPTGENDFSREILYFIQSISKDNQPALLPYLSRSNYFIEHASSVFYELAGNYSDEIIEGFVSNLGDRYSLFVAGAIFYGSQALVEKTVRYNNYREVDKADRDDILIIGDKHLVYYSAFFEADNNNRTLLEIIHRIGAQYLFDPELGLFTDDLFKRKNKEKKINFFDGKIPVVSNGIVDHPELAVAFRGEQKNIARIFSRIPCWVDKEDEGYD